ncbi:aminotransferase class V-fold PLP-dependent enzyme [Pedobacter sp. ASV28]|uniref:aminotransferase class V-fold PLP-dependent enzyme n=1 Tax=Pedobacter sp. ASV28 TaxID=2795123 RepID=UPI0018ED1CEB|nr:aminotransferase class V-fold PLP-dependent enzyme [Pedobacter sp. ASV28]
MAYCFGFKKKEIQFHKKQLPCLSVRTGFDLVLQALNLERGAEILVADINIPDMFTIMEVHGLKAIPLAVDKHTLGLSPAELKAAITPQTKLLLITHLFGAVMDTEVLLQIAQANNLVVIEDCAQAFDGDYVGHPQSDVVMFSFGLIKTNTALTGAVLQINSEILFAKIKWLNEQLPEQPTSRYLKKIINAMLINLITKQLPYTIAYQLCKLANKDFDTLISGFTRGFPGTDVMKKISYRPSYPNLRVLKNKIENFDRAVIYKRQTLASQLLQQLNGKVKIGAHNSKHTHWVIPIETETPALLIRQLKDKGFDATAKASSLVKLDICRSGMGLTNELKLENLVYLPMNLGMKESEVRALNQLLLDICRNTSSELFKI